MGMGSVHTNLPLKIGAEMFILAVIFTRQYQCARLCYDFVTWDTWIAIE